MNATGILHTWPELNNLVVCQQLGATRQSDKRLDGMRLAMERVELGMAGPTGGEEGMSAFRFGDLYLNPVSVVCVDRLSPTFVFGRSYDALIHV